jgi:hypothetical protein
VKTFRKRKEVGLRYVWVHIPIGKYKGKPEKWLPKRIMSMDSKSRFVKEAALLNSTKGHRNIIRFLGFCEDP